MKSTYDSVQEQTGLFAGNGGFDVTVGRHTQLDGAVIASTASADKNSLDTGTLGFSDLHNEADYKVSHTGISLSSSKPSGGDFSMGGMISAASNSGHAEGTTQAAVANGTITVRDKANQKQDVANLSRNTENANDSISPIFDKEKEQNRLKTVGLISDIGSQAVNIAQTQGEIAKRDAMSDPAALDAAKAKLKADGNANPTDKQIADQAGQTAMQQYGTGSPLQRGIQSVTAALQVLAGGNIAGALAGASAPELAHLLKHAENDPAVNAIAHAILGGAVPALQGNNAAAGAAGAASGELAARAIAGMLYPDVNDLSSLNESQKQTVITLASISAGMAGGIAGGDTMSAANGAQAGKNSSENNATSPWGMLVPQRTIEDAYLALDLAGKGVNNDKIIKAIDKSHIGPSVGDTAKIHGDVKGQVAEGNVIGGYMEGVLSEDKFAINTGLTKVVGWRADASAGLTFGPYPIKDFNPAYDYSAAVSLGLFSVEGSVGKDGFGGSFRVGGGIGASFRQNENRSDLPEFSGAGSTELVSWPFSKD